MSYLKNPYPWDTIDFFDNCAGFDFNEDTRQLYLDIIDRFIDQYEKNSDRENLDKAIELRKEVCARKIK